MSIDDSAMYTGVDGAGMFGNEELEVKVRTIESKLSNTEYERGNLLLQMEELPHSKSRLADLQLKVDS